MDDKEPKKLITRIVEFAAVFALSCFLFRIAVIWLKEMWWAVLLAGLLIAAVIAGYRIWKNNRYW